MTAFCTPGDIAGRLGRDLTAVEAVQVPVLITSVTGLVAAACDKTDAWATALTPVPPGVRVVSIEAVIRVLLNPAGVRSETEQLGQHQHSVSFADGTGGAGIYLTPPEEIRVRRAVFGASSATTMPRTTYDQAIELVEDGEITSGLTL